MQRIGFMQGRLVDQVEGKIQAFPWRDWQLEFPRAAALGLGLIEWTLDDAGLEQNPYLTAAGQAEIAALSAAHGVRVASLTGDCFMQAPFWKCDAAQRPQLLHKFQLVLAASAHLGVRHIVLPLVDNGRLETPAQHDMLLRHLLEQADFLRQHQLQIVFETDLGPADYAAFLAHLPADSFNVNYDIGNSASLGYVPAQEFAAYGERIVNVHVKDRVRGGTTVALGSGAADFEAVFAGLAKLGYAGNYILQTARAQDGDHAGALARYASMTAHWIGSHHGS